METDEIASLTHNVTEDNYPNLHHCCCGAVIIFHCCYSNYFQLLVFS